VAGVPDDRLEEAVAEPYRSVAVGSSVDATADGSSVDVVTVETEPDAADVVDVVVVEVAP
jgi:hypothetical protein